MTIHPKLATYPLNNEQRAIVSHKQGPLLVIAGPGSGKTHSLTLLAMNLLLCGDAEPSELVLCTYTEKAAYEMQDRILHIAKGMNYERDLSQLRIGTIHSICKQFITEYLHYTPLGNNYETLEPFTQQLLIYEHISEICSPTMLLFFQQRWGSEWEIVKKLQFFFDKIVEELIFDKLKKAFPLQRPYSTDRETLLYYLTHAYARYQKLLLSKNSLDFAHIQKCMYNLLVDPLTLNKIVKGIRYVLVDEYQDTNYIQEQILTLLTSAMTHRNLFVVGDEDQALYRFRGATVRNILEFRDKFSGCKRIDLTTNYRSHPGIINAYNKWMTTIDWSNSNGSISRTEKYITPDPSKEYLAYPAVLSISDNDTQNVAEQLAEIIYALKEQGSINDYNQVALLLHSVRSPISEPYIKALANKNIPTHCSRARTYFEQDEVRLMIGCFARFMDYQASRHNNSGAQSTFIEYIQDCKRQLTTQSSQYLPLEQQLRIIQSEIFLEDDPDKLPGKHLADFFYTLAFTEPFIHFLNHEAKLHNLVIFSQLLHTFQNYYHHADITSHNIHQIEADFFHTFLYLLFEEGINSYENQQQPCPVGHVQIMTIHQAKGLEFPVVAVGRLDKLPPLYDNEDKELQFFYHQGHFESPERIPAFDLRRLYYVAFSRAKNLLILTANKKPNVYITPLWQNIPPLSPITWQRLQGLHPYEPTKHTSPKPRYSFTNHIQMYTTCPRKFQFFREYDFLPAHSVEAFAGLLVHQTLERLHRFILDDKLDELSDEKIRLSFERVFNFLSLTHMTPLDTEQKEKALHQVLNYIHLNHQELQRITDTEMSIQVEKGSYVLTGKIDLVMRTNNGLEVLDFKTRTRPEDNSERLTFYKQQLYLYAYALKRRTGQLPKRLLLYWTAEANKQDAVMEIPLTASDVEQASQHFDDVVTKIRQQQFAIEALPEPDICQRCDIRHYCIKQGTLRRI